MAAAYASARRARGPRALFSRVYASTREEELRRVAWTPEQKDAFLRQQFEAQDAVLPASTIPAPRSW